MRSALFVSSQSSEISSSSSTLPLARLHDTACVKNLPLHCADLISIIGAGPVPYYKSIATSGAVLRLEAESATEPLKSSRGRGGSGKRILGEIYRKGDVTPHYGPLWQLERDL